jgi:hypothetical protein
MEAPPQMNFARRTFALVGLAALAGCATRTHVDEKVLTSDTRLSGSRIYIYSFLDIRTQELGPKLVAAIHDQLEKRLVLFGASTKLIEFRRTEIGRSFAVTNQAAPVPVKDTLERNRSAELEFDAKYRLMVFPRNVSVTGTGNFFSIDWMIDDISSGKEVWYMSSRGGNMKFLMGDEFPEDRAKEILDGLFQELSRRGLLAR